jgi:pyridoxine 5-phosphate synthase
MHPATALSVNVNKIAVLRNSRGGADPDPRRAAEVCIDTGCQGITVHPRPDQRHIRADDVRALRALCAGRVEFNIEGNPFAPPRAGYPGLLALVAEVRPEQCTLVPDADGQLTSDHGFDPRRDVAALAPLVAALKAGGELRVSLFVDPGVGGLASFAAIGVDRVEIYTGPFAAAFASGDAEVELRRLRTTVDDARAAGLAVNAGHDLSQANLAALLREAPEIAEVSIGHALIDEALYAGLAPTVQAYLRILRG